MPSEIWESLRDLEGDMCDFHRRASKENRKLRGRLNGLLIRACEAGMKNSEIAEALNSGYVGVWPRWSTRKVNAAVRDANADLEDYAIQLERAIDISPDEEDDDA